MAVPGGILTRYAKVLETIAAAPGGFSLTEVVRATGLPRGTVHRLLNALLEVGFAAPKGGRKIYVLGPRLLRLLHLGAAPGEAAALARPLLADLVARFGETAFLAKLIGDDIESVAMVAPEKESRSHVQPGRVLPFHAAASAKVILAYQDERFIDRTLTRPRTRFTANTRVAEADIRADLAAVRRDGYAVCAEELDPGVLSYACPVGIEGAGVLYSLGLVGLSDHLGRTPETEVVGALGAAAETLSERLRSGPGETSVGGRRP